MVASGLDRTLACAAALVLLVALVVPALAQQREDAPPRAGEGGLAHAVLTQSWSGCGGTKPETTSDCAPIGTATRRTGQEIPLTKETCMLSRSAFLGLSAASLATLALPVRAAQVGSAAPGFALTDVNGRNVNLADYRGKLVVLEWTNHECPFVRKHYNSGNMQALQKKWTGQGVVWLTVISSAPGTQGHVSPQEATQLTTSRKAAPTTVLFDPKGKKIGLRPRSKPSRATYKLRESPQGGDRYYISAGRFLDHYGISHQKARGFEARWNGRQKVVELSVT